MGSKAYPVVANVELERERSLRSPADLMPPIFFTTIFRLGRSSPAVKAAPLQIVVNGPEKFVEDSTLAHLLQSHHDISCIATTPQLDR